MIGPRAALPPGDLPRINAASAARAVPIALIRRHAGLPPEAPVNAAVEEALEAARGWYAARGEPWAGFALREVRGIEGEAVRLEGGGVLTSLLLAAELRAAEAAAVAVVGASAGKAADSESELAFRSGRALEGMCLHAVATAAAEHLRACALRALAGLAAGAGAALLPARSPGHPGWDLRDGAALLALLPGPVPIRALPSGGLEPRRSVLAACGWASRDALAAALAGDPGRSAAPGPEGPAFPEKALEKWARERVRISPLHGGRLAASFRFDGKTCTSLGTPIALDYTVTLAPRGTAGYTVEACGCAPAPDDGGLRWMCSVRDDPDRLLPPLLDPPPVAGLGLEEAAARIGGLEPSGCLCQPGNRRHKWRMALETIGRALRPGAPAGGGEA